MKKSVARTSVVVLAALVWGVAGCSSGGQQASDAAAEPDTSVQAEPSVEADAPASDPADADASEVDTAAVDETIDHFITATLILMNLQEGSLEEVLAQYEDAQREWGLAGDMLRAGIRGVPPETTEPILGALDRTQTSMTALADCFRDSATANCDAESAVAGENANALGQEFAGLSSFGTRSNEELVAILEGGGAAADTGAEEAPSDTVAGSETVSQSNAREKALEYLAYSAFSRSGLIGQLEYEGFSTADATYAVDAIGPDWNEQAALKAQEYLEYSAFSRSGLIDQLEYEGFSRAQAEFGATAVGL